MKSILCISLIVQYLRRRYDSVTVALFGWLLQMGTIVAINSFVLLGPAVMLHTSKSYTVYIHVANQCDLTSHVATQCYLLTAIAILG